MSDFENPQVKKMVENLESNTGTKLNEWVARALAGGDKHGQMVSHLKSTYGIGHGYANLVVQMARSGYVAPAGSASSAAPPPPVDLVAAQYCGAKESLRPIYDKLMAAVEGFGSDFEPAPKKSYVSLRRSKQFGLIQASTKTRVDVGIQLKGDEPSGRLEASGSFNAMVSHRVRLTSPEEVDDELIGWLRQAFDRA